MSGVGIAAGVSAAAAVAGTALSASAASKGAKGQSAAAQQAAALQEQAAQQANDYANAQLAKDIAQQQGALGTARSDVAPWVNTGGYTNNKLAQLMGQYVPATAAPTAPQMQGLGQMGGTYKGIQIPDNVSYEAFKSVVDAADQQHQGAYGGISIFAPQSGYNVDGLKSSLDPQWIQQAQAITNQKLAPLQQQYKQQQADYQKSLAAWQKQDKAAQAAYAKDPTTGELTRKFTAADYKADPMTGGNAPPDLTKNFDQAAFLAAGGHNIGDLTSTFDQTRFLSEGGRNVGDLTRKFDQNKLLAAGGHTAADLTRDFTAKDFQVDPGYQFRIQEGNKGIENSAAAAGSQLSGAAMKALARFNQDTASAEYQNSFNRFGQNRSDLNNNLNSAYNRYSTDQSNLNNSLNNAFTRFSTNQGNLNTNLNNAYNRFGVDRTNAQNVYNQAFQNYTGQNKNLFSNLLEMSGQGQNAATNQAGYTQQTAGRLSGAYQQNAELNSNNLVNSGKLQGEYGTQAANANAYGSVASSNAWGSGLANAGNALMQGYYMNNNQGTVPVNSYGTPNYSLTGPAFK